MITVLLPDFFVLFATGGFASIVVLVLNLLSEC